MRFVKSFLKIARNPILLSFIVVLGMIILADRVLSENIFSSGQFQLFSVSDDRKSTNTSVITLPYSAPSVSEKLHIFKGAILYGGYQNTRFRIVPDDQLLSIVINGQNVDLSRVEPEKLSDWSGGFVVDLGRYLTNGSNTVDVALMDRGFGLYGLTVRPGPYSWAGFPGFTVFLLLLASVLTFFYFVFRKIGFGNVTSFILLLSIATHIVFLGNVKFDEYTYDLREGGTGHLDYIMRIAETGTLPSPEGWSFYHPPLYYLTAALVYKAAEVTGSHSGYKALQALSLVYFIGFLVFAVLILKRFAKNPILFHVAVAIIAFWPSGFLHSIRIGNDIGFMFLYTVALYFISEWNATGGTKMLYWGSVFAALTILTKSNGVLLAGIIAILVAVRLLRDKDKWQWIRRGVLAMSICFAGYILGSYDNYDYVLKQGRKDWLFAGFLNISPADPALKCDNKPVNYFFFDAVTFLTEPYISTRGEKGMRQYFWNFLYKTSLFGEFEFADPFHRILATIISALFLVIVSVFWAGMFFQAWVRFRYYRLSGLKRSFRNPHQYSMDWNAGTTKLTLLASPPDLRRFLADWNGNRRGDGAGLLMFLNFFLMSIGLLVLRYKVSMPCLGDFRYVYPMVISFLAFYVFFADWLDKTGRTFWFRAVLASGALFAFCSALFYTTVA